MFIIFINDLSRIKCDHDRFNFANDTNIVVGAKLVDGLISRSDEFFEKAIEWFNKNSLVLNEQKTKGSIQN
nr:unnamed protein product [Callosobruchus chinensis]